MVPWIPKFKKPETTPVKSGRLVGWITTTEMQEEQDPVASDTESFFTVPTQLESPTPKQKEDADVDACGGTERVQTNSPSEIEGANKSMKKSRKEQPAAVRKGSNRHRLKGPNDQQLWDLLGNGDCGFRCLSAHAALRNNKKELDITQKIGKLAISLRTKVQVWLKGNDSWKQLVSGP